MATPYAYQPTPQQPPAAPQQAYAYQPPPPQAQPQPQVAPMAAPAPATVAPQPQPQPQATAPPPQPAAPQPQPAPVAAPGGFDLDDLLGTGPSTKPAAAPATAATAPPPPPDYPPPPPVNHDPFAPATPVAAPAAPAPVQQPPVQPQQPQYQQPQAQPVAQPVAPVAPVQPVHAPQPTQPAPAPAPYAYNPPEAAQPPAPAQQPAPAQVPQPAAPYSYPGQAPTATAPPAPPQQQPPQAYHAPPPAQPTATAPPPQPFHPGFDAASMNQRAGAVPANSVHAQPGYGMAPLAPHGYPSTGALGQQPTSAPLGGPGAAPDMDADRAHLEEIIRLREQLKREQDADTAKKEEGTTWACPTCTYKNKLDVIVCDICGAGRPGYSSATVRQQEPTAPASRPSPPVAEPVNNSPPPPVKTLPPGMWECPTCTFHNNGATGECSMCGTKRPDGAPAAAAPAVNAQPLSNSSPAGTNGGNGWACPTCTFENPFTANKCSMCGTPIPEHFQVQAQIAAQQARLLSGQPLEGQPASRGATNGYPAHQGGRARGVAAPSSTSSGAAAGNRDGGDDIQWQDDNVVTNCNKCNAKFTMLVRRHHCRACGFVFCSNCSSNKMKLKAGGPEERVCIDCYRERLGKPVPN